MSNWHHRGQSWAPELITPESAGIPADPRALAGHLASADVREILDRHQALLIRGFDVTEASLAGVMPLLLPERLAYIHGNTPRTKVGENVYTSTEYPPEYAISMHSELSYAPAWPARLLFFCVQPSATGGATPLLDNAAWLAALDEPLRREFSGGLCYRQYLHGGRGFGKSWQATFETDDRAQVEKILAPTGTQWEWTAGNALRTRTVRPATIRHPATGEELWFNQADQWHPATLGEDTMRELASIVPADELPQSVTFADGSPIPAEYVTRIRDTGLELAHDIAWQQGDVLLVDNLTLAHGRRPYSGARRVLVAMSH
ncbi:TauD/TfdA family dioxygenase [Kitasatospora sp. RG8]|uniref:TauD/TfdA family dioxygenase n=1 Tax=Kitasatospora sp. RG8 TaxID=2820815 RepID=UPI001ADFCEBB|nr:TauD/TfdA family dioxygenase [Kitasatospora sp. RG8]MBP0453268.1 TauD/TfdA family dioxygenase [Kitasatospora sp. RG8]